MVCFFIAKKMAKIRLLNCEVASLCKKNAKVEKNPDKGYA